MTSILHKRKVTGGTFYRVTHLRNIIDHRVSHSPVYEEEYVNYPLTL